MTDELEQNVHGLKVLYVENDEALLGLLSSQLAKDSRIANLQVSKDSTSAMELARAHKFDVTLLDISLGIGSASGVELALSIGSMQENCRIVLPSQHITPEWLHTLLRILIAAGRPCRKLRT